MPPTAYSIRAIHWEHLYEICEKHVADIEAGSVEEDKKQYIYEAAMTAVFGEKVWDWIGAKTRGA